ncbi:MAG: 50S ribosomal protein L13 [Candidatus Niyogibacteria bacterium]|nr:50S ribosomal protein L13 [Candidatus Niyogibacteria bacterium]
MTEHEIDVKGKSLGRAASEAAAILRGKNRPDFVPHLAPKIKLKILNVNGINIKEAKKEKKFYKRYSGYPSGLKEIKMKDVLVKDSREVFRKAVWGMLPKNKLRSEMIKNLLFEK